MKRKTNLFNLSNENSLFLTFSNYTEYLTGNFLSTNTKMYPSSFLCLNLELDNDSRIEFKKYLMQYYENKLTVLRTNCVQPEVEKDQEKIITPLLYLLEAINNFFEEDINIEYAGDIVEQDYNGTYSDSICIINLNTGYEVTYKANSDNIKDSLIVCVKNKLNPKDETVEDNIEGLIVETDDKETLFGWTKTQISSLYGDYLTAIYDGIDNETGLDYYDFTSKIEKEGKYLDFTPINSGDSNNKDITFNCIIPLFDIKNIKECDITENNTKEYMRSNIPLGIWLSPEKITVSKGSGFAQSWSLVIGSKFSPLPYSSVNVIDDNNSFDENTVKDIAYLTYAELLAKHSELQNKYDDCLKNNIILSERLSIIEKQLSSLLLQSDYDKIINLVDEKVEGLQDEFNKKMKIIEEYIANLKWKYIN